MKKRTSSNNKVDRRKFLAGVAVAGAAAVTTDSKAAILPNGEPTPEHVPSAVRPSTQYAQAQISTPSVTDHGAHADHPGLMHGKPGSDYMLDCIKALNIDYVITNPASSCRGLHDSIVTYGNNSKPELLTVMHEETGTAMAHGYYKVTGKPAISLCHGTVGLQHAAMAIYNAWCDRAPVIMMIGNSLDANQRRPGVAHDALGAGSRCDGPRLHQMGRSADIAHPFRRVDDAGLSHRDDAAL